MIRAGYRLTLLKKLAQSDQPLKIKESRADLEVLSDPVPAICTTFLQDLNLGAAGIRLLCWQRSEIPDVSASTKGSDLIATFHATAFVGAPIHRCQDT